MAFEHLSVHEPDEAENPNRLSPNGQMLAIGIYGALVLIGFFFGIVTGYQRPQTIVVAKPDAENNVAKVDPNAVLPKPNTSVVVEPKDEPKPEIKEEPKPEPKTEPTRTEEPPPKPKPAVVEPKKPEPKPMPKTMPDTPEFAISFEKQVKPILMRYCGNCHGNVGKPKGDVDLRTLAAITNPDNPPILVPGDPKKSAIFFTIDDMSMPPQAPRPGKGELDLIRQWIQGGAKPRRRKVRVVPS